MPFTVTLTNPRRKTPTHRLTLTDPADRLEQEKIYVELQKNGVPQTVLEVTA
jgi:hypothetical protein